MTSTNMMRSVFALFFLVLFASTNNVMAASLTRGGHPVSTYQQGQTIKSNAPPAASPAVDRTRKMKATRSARPTVKKLPTSQTRHTIVSQINQF